MGLDMYLELEISVYGDKIAVMDLSDDVKAFENITGEYKLDKLVVQAMYWRKANQIHNWFGKRLEDVDNCRYSNVSEDNIIELIDLCKKVLAKRDKKYSEKYLPCMVGFFYGDQNYDDYYYKDLEYTIEAGEKLLKFLEQLRDKDRMYDLRYMPSW